MTLGRKKDAPDRDGHGCQPAGSGLIRRAEVSIAPAAALAIEDRHHICAISASAIRPEDGHATTRNRPSARAAPRSHDARGEDRPDDPGLGRLGDHRPEGVGRLHGRNQGGPDRRDQQPVGPGGDARGAAGRGRGNPSGRTAAVRLRRDPRPPHHLPDPAGRGGGLRSGAVGADGARRRHGSRCGRADPRLRPDAGCGARSALGPDRGEPGRRPLARVPLCRSQGARFPGPGHRPSGQSGGHRQAPRGLRRGHRRPGLRLGGHLGALVPGGLSAAVPRGRGCRSRRDHASVPRPRGGADDGECRRVGRPGAPPLGVRGRSW